MLNMGQASWTGFLTSSFFPGRATHAQHEVGWSDGPSDPTHRACSVLGLAVWASRMTPVSYCACSVCWRRSLEGEPVLRVAVLGLAVLVCCPPFEGPEVSVLTLGTGVLPPALFFFFEAVSPCVIQAGLELSALLPQASRDL
jgi:hypothetical protein